MGDLIQFRPRSKPQAVVHKPERGHWMGHTNRGDYAGSSEPIHDLTMGRADPELEWPDSGDCA